MLLVLKCEFKVGMNKILAALKSIKRLFFFFLICGPFRKSCLQNLSKIIQTQNIPAEVIKNQVMKQITAAMRLVLHCLSPHPFCDKNIQSQ